MPSGPSLQQDNQWERTVWVKSGPQGKAAKSSTAVNQARRAGQAVETDKKINAGGNKSAHSSGGMSAAKLDEHTETFKHETVSHDFKLALQQARLAKKMSQQVLAQAINEKPQVVNEYEAGKAVPNGAIIQKLNRALGVRLPKAK